MKALAAAESNPRRKPFKKKEPEFKKRKIRTPPGNVIKGHSNVEDVMSINDINEEDGPRSGKEMPNRANRGAVPEKLARKGEPVTNPLDVDSFLISLLSGKPRGMSLPALKKALEDKIPGSIKDIMPIIKRITDYRAPGRYLLKLELQNYKKPSSENGSKQKLKQLEKGRMNSTGEHSGFSEGQKIKSNGKRVRKGGEELNEDEMADFIVDDERTDNAAIFCSIFGGGDEYKLRNQRSSEIDKNASADFWRRPEGEFEALGLSDHNFTPKDHFICMTDIPERLQFYEPPADETNDESEWIVNQLKNELAIKMDDIKWFLVLMHVQKLDVPFIAMYRNDKCLSLFKDPDQHEAHIDDHNKVGTKGSIKMHRVLWRIQELDQRWLLLQKRKDCLLSQYKKQYEVELANRLYKELRPTLNDDIFESIIKSLKAAESEREVDDVNLKFNLHFPRVGGAEGIYKRPPPKPQNSGYETSQEDMVVAQIRCEPCIRRAFRLIFMKNALVSTRPTDKGLETIDPFHPYAQVKCIEKKLTQFVDYQWLVIQNAEEEGFLEVIIKLPPDVYSEFMFKWKTNTIVDAGFADILSSLEKEARVTLTRCAKDCLLAYYAKLLFQKVSMAPPYKRKENNDVSSDEDAAPRVMACCRGSGNPVTVTFVMLDSFGELEYHCHAKYEIALSDKVNHQMRNEFRKTIGDFMIEYKPDVVVIGGVNLSCTRPKDDICEIISKIIPDDRSASGHKMDVPTIVYGDESLPRIYECSKISKDQLPEQPGIVKRAVALGRYLQNPLAMVATLCGRDREILSWKFSPLESCLTDDEKYNTVEQVMVDVTNQVGLDLNLAIAHEWLFSPLQFISGLGPSKAASLRRSLLRSRVISTREALMECHGLGVKVYENCAGFLSIRGSSPTARTLSFDLLDSTRIHPESYPRLKELARVIFLADNPDMDDDMEKAVRYVREQPTCLRDAGDANWEDLIQGFQDWRRQYGQGLWIE